MTSFEELTAEPIEGIDGIVDVTCTKVNAENISEELKPSETTRMMNISLGEKPIVPAGNDGFSHWNTVVEIKSMSTSEMYVLFENNSVYRFDLL